MVTGNTSKRAGGGTLEVLKERKQAIVMAVPSGQLEKESRRMEERLGMLREMMRAEKHKRRVAGDVRWRSARPGPLQPRAVQSGARAHEKGQRPVRVKVLTGQRASTKDKASSRSCGQCDKFSASLVCVECAECYCSVCFAKFHQKGALSKHHVRPLVCKVPADTPKADRSKVKSDAVEGTSVGEGGGGQLLQGMYDEASSAAVFQEALAAWRRQGPPKDVASNTGVLKSTGSSTQTSSGTQADAKIPLPEIQFSSHTGVSYFEKLMVRWHRVEPLLPVHREGREEHVSREDSPLNSSISQYNLFYGTDEGQPSSPVCSVSEEYLSPEGAQMHSQQMPAEIGMETSVKLAWADNPHVGSPGDQLTRFFLSGVEGADGSSGVAESPQETGSSDADPPTYMSAHWMPSASIVPSGEDSGHDILNSHHLDVAMDLPPAGMETGRPMDSEDSSSDSELLVAEGEGEWEVCERERCDSQALESLARELTSSMSGVEDTVGSEEGSPVDMGKVISEFELYQQQLLELDS